MKACSVVRPTNLVWILGAALSLMIVAFGPTAGLAQVPDDVGDSDKREVRTLADIHQDLRSLEKETAKAKSDDEKSANIVALCRLFVEIGTHPELPTSPTMQSLSVRLRTRLAGIERRTITELKKRKIPEPEFMVEEEKAFRKSRVAGPRTSNRLVSSKSDSDIAKATSGKQASTGKADQQGLAGGQDASRSSDDDSGQASSGGQDLAGGNPAPGPDYGWTLVNLIRKTIRPDYWSVVGGPGKAIYFGQARALVIHGSWRVQEDVAQLLTALRGG